MTPLVADSAASRKDADAPPGVLYRQFTIDMVARADTQAAEDDRIPVAISSEAPVERMDWWTGERFMEVLSHEPGDVDLSYARDGLPFCRDHDITEQIGLLEDVSVDTDGRIRGMLRQGNHPDAPWLFADMRSGIRKKVSIGYVRGDTYDQDKPNKGDMPTRRYRGWMLYEASTVTVPADYEVGIGRSGARGTDAKHVPPATDGSSHQESRMNDNGNGGQPSVPATAAAPALSREAQLAALAEQHNDALGTLGRLAGWITTNTSIDDARSFVMEEYRKRQPAPPAQHKPDNGIHVGADREAEKPFGSFVEQLRAIKEAANGRTDKRLLHLNERAAPTGMGEQVGTDGGFLIQPEFSSEIFRIAYEQGAILSRVREIPVSGNTYSLPAIDETSRTNGNRFGGVRSFWAGENDTVTSTRPKFRQITFNVTKKLITIGYVTEEQLEDAPATSSILEQAFADETVFTAEQSIVSGNGVGQLQGYMTSGALVTQAAEGGQTAGTVVAANITKMWSRLLPQARRNAVWLINQDAEPQLPLMTIGNWPVYQPPGGLSQSPYGTLYNRPVIAVEYASTIGQVGDIMLVDLSFYGLATKGGLRQNRSMHVRFINGEETFRTTWRADGLPLLNSPITPLNGSNTQSAFVTLAAR